MKYFLSDYRITYTPQGESPVILLDAMDWCDGPLALGIELAAQVEQGILACWATHHSRGNAQMPLEFTHYAVAVNRAAAQLAGIERQLWLAERPEGEILLETAFAGPTPQVAKRLNATLQRCSWRDLQDQIFTPRPGLELHYSFLISPKHD